MIAPLDAGHDEERRGREFPLIPEPRTLLDEHRLAVTKRLERAQGRLNGTMPDAYTDALVGLIDMEDIKQ